MLLDQWLSARDREVLRTAWRALAPVRHEVSRPFRELTVHGAAQLAGAMLGERPDWIVDFDKVWKDHDIDRVTDGCFFDDAFDVHDRLRETWRIREQRDGARGVQVVSVECGTVEGRPEGAGYTVVRICDGKRAASIVLGTRIVSTIGEIDLAPLDLVGSSHSFRMPVSSDKLLETDRDDVPMLRGLIAQLAAEIDAHYDTSPLWPQHGSHFVDGERSISIVRDAWQTTVVTVHGLPWGQRLEMFVGVNASVVLRLPDADTDRVLARLETIAKPR